MFLGTLYKRHEDILSLVRLHLRDVHVESFHKVHLGLCKLGKVVHHEHVLCGAVEKLVERVGCDRGHGLDEVEQLAADGGVLTLLALDDAACVVERLLQHRLDLQKVLVCCLEACTLAFSGGGVSTRRRSLLGAALKVIGVQLRGEALKKRGKHLVAVRDHRVHGDLLRCAAALCGLSGLSS